MSIIIYHNPECGTSRNALAMIRQSGEEPDVIEYLRNPPSRQQLAGLIAAMGIVPRQLLREKGTPYAELGLDDPKWTDDEYNAIKSRQNIDASFKLGIAKKDSTPVAGLLAGQISVDFSELPDGPCGEALLRLLLGMSGSPLPPGAVELATWLEESVRGLLRQAALGELGNDLSTVADETLIVSGLAEGDAEIMVSAEESAPEVDEAPIETFEPEPSAELQLTRDELPEEEYVEQETRIMEPIPAEDEIKITATPWLEEVSDPRGESIEWPADSDRDIQHRERIDTPRVRHLFPVPEDADWEVSHLEFEYSRNRAG